MLSVTVILFKHISKFCEIVESTCNCNFWSKYFVNYNNTKKLSYNYAYNYMKIYN